MTPQTNWLVYMVLMVVHTQGLLYCLDKNKTK